jgi:hypothetical protein
VNRDGIIDAVGGADQPTGRKGGQRKGEHTAAQQQDVQKPDAQKTPEAQPGDQQAQTCNENGVQHRKKPGGLDDMFRRAKVGTCGVEDGKEEEEQENGKGFGSAEQAGHEPFFFMSFRCMSHRTILLERTIRGGIRDLSWAVEGPQGNKSLGYGAYPEFSYNILLSHGIRVLLISLSGNPTGDQIRQERDPDACFGVPSIVMLNGPLYFKASSF